MASDKRRNGSGGKVQRSMNLKPSLKQKTLFDSFLKSPSQVPYNPPSQGVEINPSVQEEPTATSTPTKFNAIDTTLEVIPSEPVDIPETETTTSNVESEPDRHSRSPSIVILDATDTPSITLVQDHDIVLSQSQRSVRSAGLTRETPIVIASSPIKPSGPHPSTNKPLHPFFASRTKLKADLPSTSTPTRRSAEASSQLPIYLDGTAQHVKGPQTRFDRLPRPLPPRTWERPISDTQESHSYKFLQREDESVNQRSYEPFGNPAGSFPHDIPPAHKFSHPAIVRLVDLAPDHVPVSQRPWMDKWRPTCAREVLGNERSALYLRDWLLALKLQLEDPNPPSVEVDQTGEVPKAKVKPDKRGTKRPRVVRAIDKSRRRKKKRLDSDEEDNWIVHTDEEAEEEAEVYDPATDDFFDDKLVQPPMSSPSSSTQDIPPPVVDSQQQDLGQLHNTILLVGPCGSGKTASVYACAEELGWDVFEVYPGIGRRNGANVDNLIGEVGKNHQVIPNPGQAGDVLKSFLRRKGKPTYDDDPSSSSFLPSYSPRKKVAPHNAAETKSTTNPTVKPVRQSLVLLEEVDILFKEDSNFWSSVTRIIKECKRPVVCTCNDISLVPLEDLPLQTVLWFTPCAPDAAVSYLQALFSAEGQSTDRTTLFHLYTDPQSPSQDLLECSLRDRVVPDLRRAINALQVACPTNIGPPEIANNYLPNSRRDGGIDDSSPSLRGVDKTPRQSMRRNECMSSLDSDLGQGFFRLLVATDLGSHAPSEDDENGHAILHDLHSREVAQFGVLDRHADIISSTIQLARGLFQVDVNREEEEAEENEEQRRRIQREQRPALEALCPMATWTRCDGPLVLDYLPTIRQMVEADDRQEQLEMEKRPRFGRSTRNSARSGYVRTVEVTEAIRQAVWVGALSVDEAA